MIRTRQEIESTERQRNLKGKIIDIIYTNDNSSPTIEEIEIVFLEILSSFAYMKLKERHKRAAKKSNGIHS